MRGAVVAPAPASAAAPAPSAARAPRAAGREAFALFAVAAPGLEPVVARELAALGVTSTRIETGGVSFSGGSTEVYRANLWLRSASRVVVRMAEFEARAFHELERLSRKVPWEEFVSPGSSVRFRVTCRKSRLYHSDGVADRLGAAVERRVQGARVVTAAADEDHDDVAAQLYVVRVLHDRVSISVDTSGSLLHQRGYRLASGKAPLRETLGAAMVLASGWTPPASLMDPMCGSGTLPIEAAMIARRIAPGLNRQFAFMRWPDLDAKRWSSLLDEALTGQAPGADALIRGSDRDAGVVQSARENAARAGVAGDVEFEESNISALRPLAQPGWVLTNPPYGVRVGDSTALRDLYAQLGNVLRSKFSGWRVGLLSADRKLEGQLKLPLVPVFETGNGGIAVRFLTADV